MVVVYVGVMWAVTSFSVNATIWLCAADRWPSISARRWCSLSDLLPASVPRSACRGHGQPPVQGDTRDNDKSRWVAHRRVGYRFHRRDTSTSAFGEFTASDDARTLASVVQLACSARFSERLHPFGFVCAKRAKFPCALPILERATFGTGEVVPLL